jgi:hypothetical protein
MVADVPDDLGGLPGRMLRFAMARNITSCTFIACSQASSE